jgi:cell wall-associated NlpC family hydrolase
MNALSPRIFTDLLGKPWQDGARGPDAYDCVGLVLEIQRRRGIDVPEYVSSEAEFHRQFHHDQLFAECPRLAGADPGCVALFKVGVNQHHLGVMVDRYRMIHTAQYPGCAIVERILGPIWERRLIGFYLVESRSA